MQAARPPPVIAAEDCRRDLQRIQGRLQTSGIATRKAGRQSTRHLDITVSRHSHGVADGSVVTKVRQIEVFLALMRGLSITDAVRILNVTQSAQGRVVRYISSLVQRTSKTLAPLHPW